MDIPYAFAVTLDACWQRADSLAEEVLAMESPHSPSANTKTLLEQWSTDGECRIEWSDGNLLSRSPPYAILEISRSPRHVLVRRNRRRTGWQDDDSPDANLWYAEILGYIALGFLTYDREQLPPTELEFQRNTVRYFAEQIMQRLNIEPR